MLACAVASRSDAYITHTPTVIMSYRIRRNSIRRNGRKQKITDSTRSIRTDKQELLLN